MKREREKDSESFNMSVKVDSMFVQDDPSIGSRSSFQFFDVDPETIPLGQAYLCEVLDPSIVL